MFDADSLAGGSLRPLKMRSSGGVGGSGGAGGSVRHSRARSLSRQLASSRATLTFSPPRRSAACHPVIGGWLCCEEDHGQTGGRRGGVEEGWRCRSSWLGGGWTRRRGGCHYARLALADGPWE